MRLSIQGDNVDIFTLLDESSTICFWFWFLCLNQNNTKTGFIYPCFTKSHHTEKVLIELDISAIEEYVIIIISMFDKSMVLVSHTSKIPAMPPS